MTKQAATEPEHLIMCNINRRPQIFADSTLTAISTLGFSGFTNDTKVIQIPEILIIVKGTSNNKVVWNFKFNKVLPISNFPRGRFH